MKKRVYKSIGLMSGTSMDGIDAALIETDGHKVVSFGPFLSFPYGDDFRFRLRSCLWLRGDDPAVSPAARELTELHAGAVLALCEAAHLAPKDIDLVGFHGHTILHEPDKRQTWQIGDGALLAKMTGIDVVADFRSADVAAGGQGAPLVPLFHEALAADLPKPLAILNIGGVANVTWLGREDGDVLAFDTGPGGALIDDWVHRHTGRFFDKDGQIAASGRVNEAVLAALMKHPYFSRKPPKSLDRNAFSPAPVDGLSAADGAATLTAFTTASVRKSLEWMPDAPKSWLITGGGRHNVHLISLLARELGAPVSPVESVGWNGDALEAQAFAFLAVRSRMELPLSLPTTTGAPEAMRGGVFFSAKP